MPIECVWMGGFSELPPDPYEPGWVFYGGPWSGVMHLSDHYKAHVKQLRGAICVILPIVSRPGYGSGFCIDSAPTKDRRAGWEITVDMESLVIGQKPRITVAPSIHCLGMYHGFLQDGVLTDDIGA